MDLEALLAEAQAAIDAGADPEAVIVHARAIGQAQGFNGDLGSIVKNRSEAAELKREADVINRVEDRGSVFNTAGMLAQGVTAGLLPDFLNLIGAENASEKFRTFVEENREVHPILSGITEAAGAVAIPGAGAVKATGAVSRGLTNLGTRVGGRAGGLLAAPATTAAVVGAGAGSAGGGLFGFAESVGEDPGARLRSTLVGAADPLAVGAGAAVGPLAGFGGSRLRRLFGGGNAGKAGRVAGSLEEATDLSRDINALRNRADLNVETARLGLDRVERQTPEIVSADLEEFLDNLRGRSDVAPNLTRASREVAGGERFANVRDMRRLRDNLRASGNFTEVGLLEDILDADVPGFKAANQEFAQMKTIREAIELGQQGGGTTFSGQRIQLDTGANFEKALEIIPVEAHEALKTGVLHRELQNILGERSGSSIGVLKRLADDSAIDMRLRSMFTDPSIAEEFVQGVDKEISTDRLRSLLVRGGVLLAIGAGARASFGSSISGFIDE